MICLYVRLNQIYKADMKEQNNTFDFLVENITARVVEWIMRDQKLGLE